MGSICAAQGEPGIYRLYVVSHGARGEHPGFHQSMRRVRNLPNVDRAAFPMPEGNKAYPKLGLASDVEPLGSELRCGDSRMAPLSQQFRSVLARPM
jgi:hypothetical protein